jgi:hypothetical protein
MQLREPQSERPRRMVGCDSAVPSRRVVVAEGNYFFAVNDAPFTIR